MRGAGTAIDLNADLGEGFGNHTGDDDLAVIPLVTSANIACGFHAGDPRTMDAAVSAAREHQVQVGAHPSYPDAVGFGRRAMQLGSAEITTDVVYQIGALDAFCRRHGVQLGHVKPHGALGNQSWVDRRVADSVCDGVFSVDPDLVVVALADSELERSAIGCGLRVVREAFLDRAYRPDGTLVPRDMPGAVLRDSRAVVERALRLVQDGTLHAADGTMLDVRPDTLCLHGDTAGAAGLLHGVRAAFQTAGVAVRPFTGSQVAP